MGMPVKLSDELVESARGGSRQHGRSITGQIEHWPRIGRSVETVLRHQDVRALNRSPLSAPLTGVAGQAIQSAMEKVAAEIDRRPLERRVKAGRAFTSAIPRVQG